MSEMGLELIVLDEDDKSSNSKLSMCFIQKLKKMCGAWHNT